MPGFRLGPWLVEPSLNRISTEGREVRLEGKVMGVLVALASRPSELVTKDELLQQVWPDVVVVEGVVKRCIAELRDALEDDAHRPRFIETISRRGYRLLVAVEAPSSRSAAAEQSVEPPTALSPAPPRFANVRARLPLIVVVSAVAAVAALGAWRVLPSTHESATPAIAAGSSVAVLPFEYYSADTSNSWLAAGLTEEMTHSLANVPRLRVAARTSSSAFRTRTITVPEIGRELNVDAVLEGSIRADGDRIRVTAQLINAQNGLHVWSRVFDRDLQDLFAVQDEIARAVAETLRGKLTDTGETIYKSRASPTRNFEAYALYLNALSLWRERGAQEQRRAADLLKAAIALDSSFASAHAVLGNVYYTLIFYGGMPYTEMAPLAEREAREALRLNPTDSDALTVLAVLSRGRLDWQAASASLEAAVAADPSNSTAQMRHAELLFAKGYLRRGAAQIEAATRIDPLAASVRSAAAGAAALSRDPEGALAAANAARALGSPRGGQIESWVYLERGEFGRAGAARTESFSQMKRWSAHIEPVYAAMTDRARLPEALAVMAGAPESAARTEGFFFYEYAILGELDLAAAALDRLEGSTDTLLLLWLPELSPLRQTPGFTAAMKKLGLVDYWLANGLPDLCEQRSGQIVCR